MNLNRQLLAWIGGLGLAGAVLSLLLVAVQMGSAAREEMRGSQALAELLITAAQAAADPQGPAAAALQTQIEGGGVRHLVARWSDDPAPPSASASSQGLVGTLAPWLLDAASGPIPEHRIRIGARELVLSPAPDSELNEVVNDAGRLLAGLTAALVLLLGGVWWLVRTALAPAQALCDGVARLQAGADEAGFPPVALQEYRRIGAGIDELARRLSAARTVQHGLNQRLIALQETERQALARDLHDEMGQHLAGLSATAATVARHADHLDREALRQSARHLQQGLRAVSHQLRSTLARLRPVGLDGQTLPHEAQQLVDTWRAGQPAVQVAARIDASLPAWSADTVLTLYRSLQEALTNVRRHSGATAVDVVLEAMPDGRGRLLVQDNGRGPQGDLAAGAGALPVAGAGTGLMGMAERASMVGGSLTVDRRPGGGWRVQVHVPAPFPGADAGADSDGEGSDADSGADLTEPDQNAARSPSVNARGVPGATNNAADSSPT